MLEYFWFYLGLVIAICLLIMLAARIKVAYPILLVLAGLVIGFFPGIPVLEIDPHLIFVIFLPPLLYEAAWAISWKELWKWRRIIGSFAFLVVFLTAWTVALVTNAFIPGFTLALGFLLGGIVSPPDAISVGAILKFVKLPKRVISILEGESLLNDASSLIIFRFALIAVGTGQFVWHEAALSFGWMVLGGIGIGLIVAWVFLKMHQRLPTDANIDIVFTLVTPYVMYLAAEQLHSSGIMAVVSGGLFLSTHRYLFLGNASRIRGVNVWNNLVFLLNGLVFMIIGLSLPHIIANLGTVSLRDAIWCGVLVTGVLIIGRIISAYGALITTLIMRNFITVADKRNPGFKIPFVLGWSGMRGVVSLAAALSIPLVLEDGTPFPQRNLILFITFVVILLTLLLQGLTLPYVIRKINMPDPDHDISDEEEDNRIRKELSAYALRYMTDTYGDQIDKMPFLQQLEIRWQNSIMESDAERMGNDCEVIYADLLDKQRAWLLKKNETEPLLDEDIVRKYLSMLDIEEEKINYM